MSFLLCHDCYTWVEPLDNRCPECLLVMDLWPRIPPVHLLREVMGNLTGRLGEVRIPASCFPNGARCTPRPKACFSSRMKWTRPCGETTANSPAPR